MARQVNLPSQVKASGSIVLYTRSARSRQVGKALLDLETGYGRFSRIYIQLDVQHGSMIGSCCVTRHTTAARPIACGSSRTGTTHSLDMSGLVIARRPVIETSTHLTCLLILLIKTSWRRTTLPHTHTHTTKNRPTDYSLHDLIKYRLDQRRKWKWKLSITHFHTCINSDSAPPGGGLILLCQWSNTTCCMYVHVGHMYVIMLCSHWSFHQTVIQPINLANDRNDTLTTNIQTMSL